MTQWRGMRPPHQPSGGKVPRINDGRDDDAIGIDDLKIRGWTDAMIRDYLGDEDFRTSVDHWANFSGRKVWYIERVVAAEVLPDFKERFIASLNRRTLPESVIATTLDRLEKLTAYHQIIDGIAKGDAIGGPTALAEIVAESLIANNGLDTTDITSRYLEWWRGGSFDTGPTYALVFKLIDDGVEPSVAVKAAHDSLGGNSAGCGPAHRNSVIAACSSISTDDVPDAARAEALITHHDPIAGDAAAVVALLCRCLLEGMTWEAAKEFVGRHPGTSAAFAEIIARPLDPGGFALDAVRAAIGFMDGEDALERAIEFAGEDNYCPVIVGALLGATQGK
jgi:hypothetical protein